MQQLRCSPAGSDAGFGIGGPCNIVTRGERVVSAALTDGLPLGAPDDGLEFHQPRLAEAVAGVLRRRIVQGSLPDGTRLPKQDELLREFKVSRPSLREGIRILEAEGLLVVKRGNVGGAIVRVPTAQGSAHTFGLVLQSRHVVVGDLAEAIRSVEPVAAALCARRNDRQRTVLPRLRAVQREASETIGDGARLTQISRRFHEEMVLCCGNQTLIVMLGTFEAMWSQQEKQWAQRAESQGSYPSVKSQKDVLVAHEAILEAIDSGDEDRAARLAASHLQHSQLYTLSEAQDAIVQAPPIPGPKHLT